MRFVKVRCRACREIVDAEPTMRGALMWGHALPDGSECPASKLAMHHEPVNGYTPLPARGKPAAIAPSNMQTPRWRIAERLEEYFAEKAAERLDDEYSGDYRARRPVRTRCRSSAPP
jgi:hypothetical protein